MQYAIELSPSEVALLQQKAMRQGIKAEELLQSLITRILSHDFMIDGQPQNKPSIPNENDSVEKFIGIAYSENPDWVEKHDFYLGQQALHSSGK